MAVLKMNFNQLATVLNSIVSQATGKAQITPTNESEFISVAKVGLEVGYDPLLNAVSQVLTKTLFSIRPYSRKFAGINVDNAQYGNHVRKINFADSDWETDERHSLVDGESVDQWKVKKPKVLQTNFYGENVYQRHVTIFKDQLDVAFSSSAEFGRFIAGVMQNISDQIEQAHEATARAIVTNFIAGKAASDSDNVIYLLDVYEDETGIALTPDEVKDPDNFPAFAKWLKGYLTTLSSLLTERTARYHKNFTIDSEEKTIMRHTPYADQKAYLYTAIIDQIDSSVISDVYNKENMKLIDHEKVNFWQSIDTPQGIQVTPGYNDTDGSLVENPSSVTLSNVFGLIFDREALGYTIVNMWSQSTPMNAAGGYYNVYWHFTDRFWNDFTENGVVLLLDSSNRQLTSLTVASEEGTLAGDTAIEVDPEKGDDESYAYKIGDAAQTVTYGMDVSGWTAWNGTSEITAASGKIITVVTANALNRATGSGYTSVVAKEE